MENSFLKTKAFDLAVNSREPIDTFFSGVIKRLDATYVLHRRLYNDGRHFYLCNRPDVMDCYFSNNLHNYGQCQRHPSVFKPGYVLWDSWRSWETDIEGWLKVGKPAADEFNVDHGLSVFYPNKGYCDIYDFSVGKYNTNGNINYMTNFQQILNSITSYQEQAIRLIAKADASAALLDYDSTVDLYQDKPNNKILAFSVKQFGQVIYPYLLTRREIETIYWLIRGKTVPEAALLLRISKRTVETYVNNVKCKLACKSLFQIGHIVGKYSSYFELVFNDVRETYEAT